MQLHVHIRYGTQCVHHTEALEMRLELRIAIKVVCCFAIGGNFRSLK